MKTAWIILVSCVLSLSACASRSKPAEGPAERAGKSMDETGQKANQDVRKAGDDVDEKTKKAKEDVKKQL